MLKPNTLRLKKQFTGVFFLSNQDKFEINFATYKKGYSWRYTRVACFALN